MDAQLPDGRFTAWRKILGLCACNLTVIWWLLGKIDPDLRHRLSTIEVFTLVVTPLILFYLRNNWSLSRWRVSALGVAAVTVLTYSLLAVCTWILLFYTNHPSEVPRV